MASDDHDPRETLSASERRLEELLATLGMQAVVSRVDLPARILRRARRQEETRPMLVVGSGVLAAVVTGLGALLPRAEVQEGER